MQSSLESPRKLRQAASPTSTAPTLAVSSAPLAGEIAPGAMTSNAAANDVAQLGASAASRTPILDAAGKGASDFAARARADLAEANQKFRDLYATAAGDGMITDRERSALERCELSLRQMGRSAEAIRAGGRNAGHIAAFDGAKREFWAAAAAAASAIYTKVTEGGDGSTEGSTLEDAQQTQQEAFALLSTMSKTMHDTAKKLIENAKA